MSGTPIAVARFDSNAGYSRPNLEPDARPRARRASRNNPAELTADRLEGDLVDLAGRLAAGTYELLVLVGEYDARGIWAIRGALSCAAWLADLCDIEVTTARSQVRVAKALRAHPELDAAMRHGDVSYAKARALVPYLNDGNATELIGIAESVPAGRLGAAIAAWSRRHDDAEVIDARQRDARSCAWRTNPDGTVTITATLTPTAAGAVCAVIDAQVTRTIFPTDVERFPTDAQQRADALVGLITEPGEVPEVSAEVVVHVTAGGNALDDGTPVSDHAVTRMLPDSFVSLLLHDAERQPIDASPRRRFPTRRQRRVIDQRSPHCSHPGCHATRFLQYDHIDAYTSGGPTVIANLQRLCGPHNRLKLAS